MGAMASTFWTRSVRAFAFRMQRVVTVGNWRSGVMKEKWSESGEKLKVE